MDPSNESLSDAVTVSAAARGGGGGTANGVTLPPSSLASAPPSPSVAPFSSPLSPPASGAGARGLIDDKRASEARSGVGAGGRKVSLLLASGLHSASVDQAFASRGSCARRHCSSHPVQGALTQKREPPLPSFVHPLGKLDAHIVDFTICVPNNNKKQRGVDTKDQQHNRQAKDTPQISRYKKKK